MKVFTENDFVTMQWSGGETTQLWIHPAKADFKKGNYNARISTATVTLHESLYTKLPGVSRNLMVLKGELHLNHRDHHSVSLKPFEQDTFSGDWHTESIGVVRNFNLMTKGQSKGSLKPLFLNKKGKAEIDQPHLVYVAKGGVKIEGKEIHENSLVDLINTPSRNPQITLTSDQGATLILVTFKDLNPIG